MTKTLLTVAVLALLAPAIAQARYDRAFTLSPGLHEQWPRSIRPALQLAQKTWHIGTTKHCEGLLGPDRLVVSVEKPPSKNILQHPEYIGALAAWTWEGDCVIHMPMHSHLAGGPEFCETALHEAGHIAGYHNANGPDGDTSHSPNKNNIMFPASFVLKGIGHVAGMRGTFYSWYGVDRRCMRAYGER